MILGIILISWFLVGFACHQFVYWLDSKDTDKYTAEYLQMLFIFTIFGYISFFIVVAVLIKEEAIWESVADWLNKSKESDKK